MQSFIVWGRITGNKYCTVWLPMPGRPRHQIQKDSETIMWVKSYTQVRLTDLSFLWQRANATRKNGYFFSGLLGFFGPDPRIETSKTNLASLFPILQQFLKCYLCAGFRELALSFFFFFSLKIGSKDSWEMIFLFLTKLVIRKQRHETPEKLQLRS